MSGAYTPGLLVTPQTLVSKVRELPLLGKALVARGDKVDAETEILEAKLPGDIAILRLPERMGLDPLDIPEGLKVEVGQEVKIGDLLCRVKTFFGLSSAEIKSPCEGTVEFFTEHNGHLGIRHKPVPLQVRAYISGRVAEVEEGKAVTVKTEAAVMQGIFGVGGERIGRVFSLDVSEDKMVDVGDLEKVSKMLEGAVIVGGLSYSKEALEYAAENKASAVVTGSIDSKTLAEFVGFEIGVSITGDERVPFTLIITEGFGRLPISKRVAELSKSLQGKKASVNGATQVRAGAMRPEVIVPLESTNDIDTASTEETSNTLEIKSSIRIIRAPYFGEFATVTELPEEPEKLESGAVVRILRAETSSGKIVTVPRANVELV